MVFSNNPPKAKVLKTHRGLEACSLKVHTHYKVALHYRERKIIYVKKNTLKPHFSLSDTTINNKAWDNPCNPTAINQDIQQSTAWQKWLNEHENLSEGQGLDIAKFLHKTCHKRKDTATVGIKCCFPEEHFPQ